MLYDASATGADYSQTSDCWPRPAWYTYRRFCWLLRRTGPAESLRVHLVYNERGVTVVEIQFAAPLAVGPDGGPLAYPWTRAYLVWYDQYANDQDAHPVEADRREGPATVRFTHVPNPGEPPPSPGYELLPMVPEVDPRTMTGFTASGYPSPTFAWSVPYASDALVSATPWFTFRHPPVSGGGGVRVYISALELLVQPCDPVSGVAIAPLCILTTLDFGGVA